MSHYHYSLDFLNADIGWTAADKYFLDLGVHLTAPNNLNQQKNYPTAADRFEFTEFVISNQVKAKVIVNGNLNVGAKVVVPAKAKVNLMLEFYNGDSQIILLNKPIVYVANPIWRKHFIHQINNRDPNQRYIIDSIIFARSATIIKNSAKGLASNLDLAVEIPEGIFDISTILSFAYENNAINYSTISISFKEEPGVVAFGCFEIKRKRFFRPRPSSRKVIYEGKMEGAAGDGDEDEDGSPSPRKVIYEGKMETAEDEDEGEDTDYELASITYGEDCVGFEDRI